MIGNLSASIVSWAKEVKKSLVIEELNFQKKKGRLKESGSPNHSTASTPVLMGLYSCVCLMANQLKQVKLLKVETTAWHQKKHTTFSDMLRAVRMVIWRDNLISGKGKITPSVENTTLKIVDWVDDIVRRVLQAA